MAEIDFYYPFDSVDGDRKTTAATERRFFNALFADGAVGAGAFALTQVSEGVYSIGAGVAIVGGAIGGIINAKQLNVKPALGATSYIVLRLDTSSGSRKILLGIVTAIRSESMEQLDQGGVRDLPLYSVTGQANGGYSVVDMRTYCTSFDNKIYSQDFQALYDATKANGETIVDAMRASFAAAIAEANAATAGLYGAAGRQGFINPNFAVDQRRGTAYGIKRNELFIFDHWKAAVEGRETASNIALSRNFDTAAKKLSLNITNKVYADGSGAGASCISQTIEGGVFTFCNGKKFTVSFDAKANTPQRVAVEPTQLVSGAKKAIAAQVVEVTSEWQRFSLTFDGTETATSMNGSNFLKVGFYFAWVNSASRFGEDQNDENVVRFANMQINEGAAALPCYEPPYAEQLHQCQRYFCSFGYVSLAVGALQQSTKYVTTSPLPLPRRMYRTPDVVMYDRTDAASVASVETAAGAWRNGLACSVSANSADNPVFVVTNTDTTEVTRVVLNKVEVNAEIES